MHRVKVYKLDEAGSWADWGTGHISVQVRDVCMPARHLVDWVTSTSDTCHPPFCYCSQFMEVSGVEHRLLSQHSADCSVSTSHAHSSGFVDVGVAQQADAMGLIIVSEDENTRTLLIHKISLQDIYTRSGGEHI